MGLLLSFTSFWGAFFNSFMHGFFYSIAFLFNANSVPDYFWVFLGMQLLLLVLIIGIAINNGYNGFLAFLLCLAVPLLGSLIIFSILPNKKEDKNKNNNKKNIKPEKNKNQTEYRGNKDIKTGNNWVCGKCGFMNEIFLPACKNCGKDCDYEE